MVVAITKCFDCPVNQLDVVMVFLCRIIKKEVSCVAPEGVKMDKDFECPESIKAIYGLK